MRTPTPNLSELGIELVLDEVADVVSENGEELQGESLLAL